MAGQETRMYFLFLGKVITWDTNKLTFPLRIPSESLQEMKHSSLTKMFTTQLTDEEANWLKVL